MDLYLILHNIRSLHNVGSIFRTADGTGVKKIYLTGYTPLPPDLFGKARKDLAKTALGAEKSVPWEQQKNLSPLIAKLKKEKLFIVSLEQAKRAVLYNEFLRRYAKKIKRDKGIVLIVGNEVWGISPAVLKKSDAVMELPMYGKKESLNVSVATGIALYALREPRRSRS